MGSDVVIMSSILVFLVGLGLISPLIQEGANVQVNEQDYDFTITNFSNADAGMPDYDDWSASGWIIIANIFKAVFWIFTWMPAWLVAFHILLRFALVVIAYRMIRSGSG